MVEVLLLATREALTKVLFSLCAWKEGGDGLKRSEIVLSRSPKTLQSSDSADLLCHYSNQFLQRTKLF